VARPGPGVHRRALTNAVRAADWIGPADEATVRAAKDLADILDALRRDNQAALLHGYTDSKTAWHSSAVHRRFLDYLEALRLTPATRPAEATDEADDLVANLRAVVAGN
jgi:hypothetical protein